MLFQTTKIQIFESNSQHRRTFYYVHGGCFRQQRYKFLKAIHNEIEALVFGMRLFQTTKIQIFESNSQHGSAHVYENAKLFQTTKIQIFESNSQLSAKMNEDGKSCFRQQRYKFLKAIHNGQTTVLMFGAVVSDNKDTNF